MRNHFGFENWLSGIVFPVGQLSDANKVFRSPPLRTKHRYIISFYFCYVSTTPKCQFSNFFFSNLIFIVKCVPYTPKATTFLLTPPSKKNKQKKSVYEITDCVRPPKWFYSTCSFNSINFFSHNVLFLYLN